LTESQRICYITGGSRGIGRAAALALAGPGAVVVINHYDPAPDAAEETLALLQEKGSTCEAHYYSVADHDAAAEHLTEAASKYGRLDVLVNNAGVTRDGLVLRMSEADWDLVLSINLKGAFNCAQAAAKIMTKQRSGTIINVASVTGVIGNVGQANYSASKAGVIGLTKTLARELAPRQVTVNAVAPGFIETDMTAGLPEKVKTHFLSTIPLGRAGQPEDVAECIAFLASDKAAYLTGQVLHVNGGMFM
jgi:3-oxoacyl-[acyl-carrier protein] reductase